MTCGLFARLMKDAIAFKFLSAPLSAEQLRELVVRFEK
jgi:hypothetical protein